MTGFDENTLIDLIYEAATDPVLWPSVIERTADLIQSDGGLLSQFDLVTGEGSGIIARVDPAMPAVYRRDFADKNILNNVDNLDDYLRNWAPTALTDEDWIAKDELIRSDYYNGFLKPQNIHSVLMIRLTLKDRRLNALNLHRGAKVEQFGRRDLEIITRIKPHLVRAVRLGERIASREALFDDAGERFNRSTNALFLVDGEARLLRASLAGEAQLLAPDGLLVVGRRLTVAGSGASRRLDALIRMAASRDPATRRGGSMRLTRGETSLPHAVIVTPAPSRRGMFLDTTPRVLVCLLDMEGEIAFPAALMTDLFGLTSAEVRVASLLFGGSDPKMAAHRLGVSRNTIHVHVAHLFEKTGVRRQSDLVRLMMRLAGPTN